MFNLLCTVRSDNPRVGTRGASGKLALWRTTVQVSPPSEFSQIVVRLGEQAPDRSGDMTGDLGKWWVSRCLGERGREAAVLVVVVLIGMAKGFVGMGALSRPLVVCLANTILHARKQAQINFNKEKN